jgi:hypothetical protein
VVVGHSQVGLLTRLMVTDSGTRFWDSFFSIPFDQTAMSPQTRALAQRVMFFEHQPYVTRVVFIATPHRGSFRVSAFVLGIIQKLVTLPLTVVSGLNEIATQNPGIRREALPTAVDAMRPVVSITNTCGSGLSRSDEISGTSSGWPSARSCGR